MERLIAYRTQIKGLVWDYEVGAPYDEATETLKDAYRTCNGMGLLFGVAVLANPAGSLEKNGVKYQDAKKWCDFLMPMLYSQWVENVPKKVEKQYLNELKASSVPTIPVIAHRTTSSKIAPEHELLTVARYRECYEPLNLPCFAVWNADGVKKGFWDAVRGCVS
jgi:hypothetical protein